MLRNSDQFSKTAFHYIQSRKTADDSYPQWRTYLTGDGGRIIAELFSTGSGTVTPYYIVGDNLSSVIAVTDANGNNTEYDSYDAWGKRRNANGTDYASGCKTVKPASVTLRGYTGQEMMDNFCLVNLNARMYDTTLGRMLSPDPTVPYPMAGQSYNRYSYVENGPLSFIDPSGYTDYCHNNPVTCGRKIQPYEEDDSAPDWGDWGPGVWGVDNNGDVISAAYAGWAYNNPGQFAASLVSAGYDLASLAGLPSGSQVNVSSYGIGQALGISPLTISSFQNGALTGSYSVAPQSFNSADMGGVFDVLGKIWTLPNTIAGLGFGGIGYVAGWVGYEFGWLSAPPDILFGNNAVEFLNNPLVDPYSDFTLGNAIEYGANAPPSSFGAYGDPEVNFGLHESSHTYQNELLGAFFLPTYLATGSIESLQNPFENAAQNYAKGQGSWWPR